jgi:hypothetical protein
VYDPTCNDSPGFIVCILILLVFSVFSGCLQASVFGVGAQLPFKYMGAIMFGNGISGISTNIIQVICLLSFPDPDQQFISTMVYFIISAFILVLCAISAFVMHRNPFFQYYNEKANREKALKERRLSIIGDEPQQIGGDINETSLSPLKGQTDDSQKL